MQSIINCNHVTNYTVLNKCKNWKLICQVETAVLVDACGIVTLTKLPGRWRVDIEFSNYFKKKTLPNVKTLTCLCQRLWSRLPSIQSNHSGRRLFWCRRRVLLMASPTTRRRRWLAHCCCSTVRPFAPFWQQNVATLIWYKPLYSLAKGRASKVHLVNSGRCPWLPLFAGWDGAFVFVFNCVIIWTWSPNDLTGFTTYTVLISAKDNKESGINKCACIPKIQVRMYRIL